MDQFERSAPLIGAADQIVGEIGLRARTDGRTTRIEVVSGPLLGASFSGVDFFWSLADLRNRLEEQKLKPALKGAVKWVFPGGLLGETSMGRIAARFNANGEVVGNEDIFDLAGPTEYGDILYFDKHFSFRKAIKGLMSQRQ